MIKLSIFLMFLIQQKVDLIDSFDLRHEYYSVNLVNYLINTNQELFYTDLTPPRVTYYEQDKFESKLKSELMLRVLFKSPLLNVNQIDYLNDLTQTYFVYVHQNKINLNDSIGELINQTWYTYCLYNSNKCFELCHSNRFKPNWCYQHHDSKHIIKRRQLNPLNRRFNLTNKELITDIVNELITHNMKNNFMFMNRLAEQTLVDTNQLKCSQGFKLNKLNECQDVNECNTTLNCDENAECLNTYGSYRCRCHKGYLGTGLPNRCFGGTFCSGKFCRMNGKCAFNRNRGGYKCECMLNCLNGGTCIMTQFKYECKCPLNTTGLLCNETLDFYLNKHLIEKNYTKSNESLRLSQLISLVEPVDKLAFLNSAYLSKYYSILNKFYLVDSFKNRTLFNEPIKLIDDKQTSLIQPSYYETDDYYYDLL